MILRLFGTFSVQVEGRPIPPALSRKGEWLLALLALRHGGEIERASLAGLLWPDSAHAPALYNLRRALSELRDVLGSEAGRLSAPRPHTLALDLAGAAVDVLDFDAALARGDEAALESAVDLYRGPLLAACDEEWVLPDQRAREEAYLAALESLARHAVARGDPAAALRRLREAVAVDPLRESAQQALIRALVAGEDIIGALLAYRDFRLRLRQELRAEPSPETKALLQQLHAPSRRRSEASGGERGAPGVRSEPRAPNVQRSLPAAAPCHLPRPLSPFVGRETELQAVAACLESARLVTLTGPGGVGKTRLAIQVAEAAADDHGDGVWFVDLTRLTDPALVPQAVAAALGVREEPDRPLTGRLAAFLRPQQLLLVLDNCEHLLSACAELGEALLAGSPALRVLATSRQALGIRGEVVWPVAGLSVPPPAREAGCPAPEALLPFEAVRLFVECATRATPTFSLTGPTSRAVREICQRLDGMPLAIELATARLKALSVEEIAARLDDTFRLLTGGSRTAPPRQQTLRAAMDWSYELLTAPERLLLQCLSVFTGSFSLAAVEAVVGDAGFNEVLDLLTQLVDQSLVLVERGDAGRLATRAAGETGTRYRLLETVRQYALARLRTGAREAGEGTEERLRRRHRQFYLELAETAGPHLLGPDHAGWLERLEVELGNLRAALDWTLEHDSGPEMGLRLAVGLGVFCVQRGYLEEARQRLAAALEKAGPGRHSPAGACALALLGSLAFLSDDYAAARAYYEESLTLQREWGDAAAAAGVLCALGHVARRQKEYAAARALHEQSLAIRRALDDRPGMAQSLIGLGDTLREQGEGSSPGGGKYTEEALGIRRELGDRAGVAEALGELANVAWQQGDYALARRHRQESLGLWRAVGAPLSVIHSLGALGHLARDQGAIEDARAFYTESLHLRWELGDRYTLIQALEDFAELAAAEGEWARMTRLLGAAAALREGMGKPLRPREYSEYDRFLSRARDALGEEAVAGLWSAGQALSLEQAVAFAVREAASDALQ